MKSALLLTTIMAMGLLFFLYLSIAESNDVQQLKKYPKKYAYYEHTKKPMVSWALASEDKDCLDLIRKYYQALDQGLEVYVPTCVEYSIRLHEPVYVLFEEDSTVEIACFYRNSKGKEKHFIAYVLKNSLHETPYVNKTAE